MAKYTLEISQIVKDKYFKIFDFNYDFYTDDLTIRNNFEQKFLDYYMFHEIGFETIGRFKHSLKAKLNTIMPYYKQLYISEMRTQEIDFMLNKDYKETYSRNIDDQNSMTGNNKNTYEDNSKSSDISDGVSDVSLTKGNLTSTSGNTSNSNDILNSESKRNRNESYTLEGKGNIGITSSAELLEKWRGVMINIDQMIIEECFDLFMLVY